VREAGPTDGRDQETDSHLGAALGLTDADLVEMYRYVALARAVDERMWILNRAGRIPFVIAGRATRAPRSGSPGRSSAQTGSPVLSLDRTCLTSA
jgi:nitrate reductase beta subunit